MKQKLTQFRDRYITAKFFVTIAFVFLLGGSVFAFNNTMGRDKIIDSVSTEHGEVQGVSEDVIIDDTKILVKNEDGSVVAVSQNDIANNPSLLDNVITNPTESDYQSAGITAPTDENTPVQTVERICANANPNEPYNIHKNEDGPNHDNDQYCPTVESYCQKFPSQIVCDTIKPTAPSPSSWTSYKVSTSAGKTVSDWVRVSEGGIRKCTRSTFFFDANGSTTPPADWRFPIGILGFYKFWEKVPEEYGYCTYEKRQYTNHSASIEEDIYDGSQDRNITVYQPYAATKKSYTYDGVYCTRYRVSWETSQRADKSWWSKYRVYEDTISTALISGKHTYDNNFCKQLFDGSTSIDTSTINWIQFAPDEHLNIGKQSIYKTIDATGGFTTPPAPQ